MLFCGEKNNMIRKILYKIGICFHRFEFLYLDDDTQVGEYKCHYCGMTELFEHQPPKCFLYQKTKKANRIINKKCHICGIDLNLPGAMYCSAFHGQSKLNMKLNLNPNLNTRILKPTKWIHRKHGNYSRNGDLLTIKTADEVIVILEQELNNVKQCSERLAHAIQEGLNHGYGLKIGEQALNHFNQLKENK